MLFKKLQLAALVAIASTLTGCAVTPTAAKFDPDKSRALNIAQAGGIIKGLKDTTIPKDGTGAMGDSILTKGFDAGMGWINPGAGLSSLQGLGVGLLMGLFEPDSPGARNSFIAWMPIDMAESEKDARYKIQELFFNKTKQILERNNIKYVFNYGKDIKTVVDLSHAAFFTIDDESCKIDGKRYCSISLKAYNVGKSISPEFLPAGGEDVYSFPANGGHKYNTIDVNIQKGYKLSQTEVFQEISKEMPDWFFIYLSPEKVLTKDGEKLKFPVLLEQGKANLFVIPEK